MRVYSYHGDVGTTNLSSSVMTEDCQIRSRLQYLVRPNILTECRHISVAQLQLVNAKLIWNSHYS